MKAMPYVTGILMIAVAVFRSFSRIPWDATTSMFAIGGGIALCTVPLLARYRTEALSRRGKALATSAAGKVGAWVVLLAIWAALLVEGAKPYLPVLDYRTFRDADGVIWAVGISLMGVAHLRAFRTGPS